MSKRAFLVWFFCMTAYAEVDRESLGVMAIEQITLRPQFFVREPALGRFSIGESYFSARWSLDALTSGVLSLGSEELLGRTARFAKPPEVDGSEVALVEAYAEYRSSLGRWRAGLQPVEFGLEGQLPEGDLSLERSLIFQKRLVPLRDIGLSYSIEHQGFYTRFLIHNGESGENKDGQVWYTAAWGWADDLRLNMGLAGQTGATKAASTSGSQDVLASVDPAKEAKWRTTGFFIEWTPPRFILRLEGYLGELMQEGQGSKYSSGYFHLGYDWSKNFMSALRWEEYDPDHNKHGDLESRLSLALGVHNPNKNSRLILSASKVFEEGRQIPNDELRLIWHLTPLVGRAR